MVIGNRLPGTLGVESRQLISVKRDPIVQPSPTLPQNRRCLTVFAASSRFFQFHRIDGDLFRVRGRNRHQ
ncbi:MAG: hypothetical protein OSB12_10630, partial [Planctomycetota bacterium]|nr:hypothetical protein [Planctomycetota bacterium]